jgi:glucarate dehydratase
MQIRDGVIKLPDQPGLGVEINMDKVMKANELYHRLAYHDRDDSISMQYLIKDWQYHSKKPCMVR